MTNSDGNLSIDFLVGVTIFIMAFIWVATLIPNLFLGVSAHAIDFDAVAYRTGVILAEDPGATDETAQGPWEFQLDSGKGLIERFGLAVSKETPNILSGPKVDRFFNCSPPKPNGAFIYPDDYRNRAIFGDYPYRFNISLLAAGESVPRYVGDIRPDNYGYIRRDVKIKNFSNATINQTTVKNFHLNNTGLDGNVTYHDFAITINTTQLLNANITNPVTNPNYRDAYQIDPRSDWINITIEDFNKYPPLPNWITDPSNIPASDPQVNLTQVTFSQTWYGFPGLFAIPPGSVPHKNFIYVDGNPAPVNPPIDHLEDKQNITFAFPPGFFIGADETGSIYINMTFQVNRTSGTPGGMQYLNTSGTPPWDYNYNPRYVTQPVLTDAVLEVAVW
ncbi:MAG: hypothetical protein LUO98_00645 [Methanoregula sp.]|nr:hypothetical protein [Methanoregula sp.]